MASPSIRTILRNLPALVLTVVSMAPAAPELAAQTRAQRIDALVTEYHDYGLFNGAVLVAEEGEPIYAKGFGDAVMEWDVPVTTDTRFRIGSVTKQFTAALVLQLVEEGKIDLEGAITDYLPDYPAKQGEKVTIHHLLTHTSGIPSYTGLPEFGEELIRDRFEPDSFVTVFSGLDLEFEPGSRWNYSNSGYFLLGVIVEKVTGTPYDRALRERILEPLGLDDTGYDHYGEIIERRAVGYARTPGGYEVAEYLDTSLPYSAGMMYSTVEDLLAWDRALYGKGPFESVETRDRMFEPYVVTPIAGDSTAFYGYGWIVQRVPMGADTVRVVQHGGGINGFTTGFWRIPEDRRTVVVMDNTTSRYTDELTRKLARILYGQPVEGPKRPIADMVAAVVESEGVEAAARRYRELKESVPGEYDFTEVQLNRLGYLYLREGEIDTAIAIFRLNVEAYPEAFNTYDSLAEAYLEAGEREEAIANYRRSLELNPGNENARRMLRERLGVAASDRSDE